MRTKFSLACFCLLVGLTTANAALPGSVVPKPPEGSTGDYPTTLYYTWDLPGTKNSQSTPMGSGPSTGTVYIRPADMLSAGQSSIEVSATANGNGSSTAKGTWIFADGSTVSYTAQSGYRDNGTVYPFGAENAMVTLEVILDGSNGYWYRVQSLGMDIPGDPGVIGVANASKTLWAYSTDMNTKIAFTYWLAGYGVAEGTGANTALSLQAVQPPTTPLPVGSLTINKVSVRDTGFVTLNWMVN